jgi:hypothetical protein
VNASALNERKRDIVLGRKMDSDEMSLPGPAEAPRGEVVFALAKGVAAVVAFSACLFLMVIMVFAKTFIMSSTTKYGLIPIFTVFVVTVPMVSHKMGWSPTLLLSIFARCTA